MRERYIRKRLLEDILMPKSNTWRRRYRCLWIRDQGVPGIISISSRRREVVRLTPVLETSSPGTMELLSTSASQWQERLQNFNVTSVELVDLCLDQIGRHNRHGQCLNALISVAPQNTVRERARLLDEERAAGRLKGPMHGIPIIIKDIFPTDASLGMPPRVVRMPSAPLMER